MSIQGVGGDRSEVLCNWSSGGRAGLASKFDLGACLEVPIVGLRCEQRELLALAFGCLVGVCGPCVGISGRSEIGEVTVRFGGFVGSGASAVGCTLVVWFGGRVWVFSSSGSLGSLPLICCIFLTLSVCNFLEMVTCQNGIGGCKMPLLQMDRTQRALFKK
jgi:hypothetical protein